VRCLDADASSSFVAAGLTAGAFAVYYLEKQAVRTSNTLVRTDGGDNQKYRFIEIQYKEDCSEDISDIKFSPNCKMLAVGSHDNFIDIYSVKLVFPNVTETIAPSCLLRHMKRLRGHSSYVTHLDWSLDSRLVQSTCGAGELLFWDVAAGAQLLSSQDNLEADSQWYTLSCTLGFNVMGIWPSCSDGTDVNCIDVSLGKKLVVTGDDFGNVSLFNFPCVVKDAPRKCYGGHSSHVVGMKLLESGGRLGLSLLTVGGNDCSIILWRIER
jgi:WD40 repeat protein